MTMQQIFISAELKGDIADQLEKLSLGIEEQGGRS